jgi:hypothetical protein
MDSIDVTRVWTVERDGQEIDLTVRVRCHAEVSATYSNWTGWNPPEPAHAEVLAAVTKPGRQPFELTDAEATEIERRCLEDNWAGDEIEAQAEMAAEARSEAQWEREIGVL